MEPAHAGRWQLGRLEQIIDGFGRLCERRGRFREGEAASQPAAAKLTKIKVQGRAAAPKNLFHFQKANLQTQYGHAHLALDHIVNRIPTASEC